MEKQQDNLLEITDLDVSLALDEGKIEVLNGVAFKIPRGKTVGLVGESGCGKSVTSQAILRIIPLPGRIDHGTITLHTKHDEVVDITSMDARGERIRNIRGNIISMIFQEPMAALSPLHTAGHHIMESVLLHRKDIDRTQARDIALDMMRKVRIPSPEINIDSYPHQLSGGMCQRVMIATALACHPDMLIADEPTTALDVTVEAQILHLIESLQHELNMSVLFISHNLGVIAEMADEVAVMYLGKIVEKADVVTLFHHPLHPYTQALLRSIPQSRDKVKTKLNTIKGSVPDAFHIPSGCSFHPRCPEFMNGRCNVESPPLVSVEEGHQVRCLLYEET